MLWGGGEEIASIVADVNRWSTPMQIQTPNDLSQSRIVLKQDSTLIAVVEMSLSSWLVAGIVPGVERQPLKKLAVSRRKNKVAVPIIATPAVAVHNQVLSSRVCRPVSC
jgi:hypothetical protein